MNRQHKTILPRLVSGTGIALLTGLALLSVSRPAAAQSDMEFAPPDVMLLVDTSGSMALTSVRDPNNPSRYALPKCGAYPNSRPVDLTATSFSSSSTPPDRWTALVSVLTGTVKNLECTAQPRTSQGFKTEYSLGGVNPYDQSYYMPYNRIVAKDGTTRCVPAPSWSQNVRNELANNAVKWPDENPIIWRDILSTSNTNTCGITNPQDTDGLIDQFQRIARFGLMTFDPMPNWLAPSGNKTVGVGIALNSDPPRAHYPSGVGDTWSYFMNWMTDSAHGSAATGWPGGCNEQNNALLEVGVRNPAAPPWEGRLIGFGDPAAGEEVIVRNNERVQKALLAMRPYGATPIAGMLRDARYFLLSDNTLLQDHSQSPPIPYFWGGKQDPGVSTTPGEGCRKRFIILLTDGGPNLDLRPGCSAPVNGIAGKCPYPTPADSAEVLAANNIPVYVIGFSVSSTNGGNKTCSELLAPQNGNDACSQLTACTSSGCSSGQCAYGYCINTPNDETLAACCTIRGIANKGGTQPFFAENFGSLYNAFSQILSGVVKGTRSRTQPVYATGNANYTGSQGSQIAAAQFLSSFKTTPGDLFEGQLERVRYQCQKSAANAPLKAELQDFDVQKGDDFGKNVQDTLSQRKIFTVVAEKTGSNPQKIESAWSIRPLYTNNNGDHLATVTEGAGDSDSHMVGADAASFDSLVPAKSMLGDQTCSNNSACCFPTNSHPTPSSALCKRRTLRLELGLSAGESEIKYRRGSAFGAIMHSTPKLVNPPGSYLDDQTYRYYASIMKQRPSVLYAATTDGQLHAFKVGEVTKNLNELWSFIPPAMLPSLGNQFPDRFHASPQALLDGTLVSQDVAGLSDVPTNGRFLTRSASDVKLMSNARTHWYTILVGSFGSKGGYFAMDVTWPELDKDAPANYHKGPRFLWQLTTDEFGMPLFGKRSSPPTITTLFFRMPGEQEAKEHAVAILPGGKGGSASDTSTTNVTFDVNDTLTDSRFPPRGTTRVYSPEDTSPAGKRSLGGARSLTIVRLDTGEIIRTFRHGAAGSTPNVQDMEAPAGLYAADRVTPAPFDAPVVGRVVAFPSRDGEVANRAFVGDAEGRLWRVDLSSLNPADWNVKLFHDAYPGGNLTSYTWRDGAPIATPPVMSVDRLGRLTLAVSTGDQITFSRHGKYPAWSLTETPTANGVRAHVNWVLNENNAKNRQGGSLHLHGGERITGPMTLFNSKLYFTTYDPSSENPLTCEAGESYLWGVHYLRAGDDASQPADLDHPEKGPMPWMDPNPPDPDSQQPQTPSPPSSYLRYVPLGQGSVAFGVGITVRPSCYETATSDGDPFFGGGSTTTITNSTPASFQLTVQTGRVGDGGGTKTKVSRRNLPPPLGGAHVDSWAAILD